MKFGKTEHPGRIDFSLPDDHPGTREQLGRNALRGQSVVHVGCAKWNRQDLKNFYPRGTKDELGYYSSQFNCVELNATFYRVFSRSVFTGWKDRTSDDFVFFPKLPQTISHRKRLRNVQRDVDEFLDSASCLGEKLGTTFLQMMETFGPGAPGSMEKLSQFVLDWPSEFSLAVELRHRDWFVDPAVRDELYALLEEHGVGVVLTDVAARRELLHMRLTTPAVFIRYVGANHKSDYTRLTDWVERLKRWSEQGVRNIAFFVHQHDERESPLLARHLIEQLNTQLQCNLRLPTMPQGCQESLF